MNKAELAKYIGETYQSKEEHLWVKYPEYSVFRHDDNRKWFAIMMNIKKDKLGDYPPEPLEILDIKLDPVMIGSLLFDDGFYRAYHMNKASWITVALDGSVDDETIKTLLDMSYEITAKKKTVRAKKTSKKKG